MTALEIDDGPTGATVAVTDLTTGDVVRTLDIELTPQQYDFGRNLSISGDGRIAAVQTGVLRVEDDLETCCLNDLVFFELDTGALLDGSQLLDMRTGDHIDLGATGATAYIRHPFLGSVTAVDTGSGEVRTSDADAFDHLSSAQGRYDSVASIEGVGVVAGDDRALVVYDPVTLAPRATVSTAPDSARTALVADGQGGVIGSGNAGIVRVDVSRGAQSWFTRVAPGHECQQLVIAAETDSLYCNTWNEVVEYFLSSGIPTGRKIFTQLDLVAPIGVFNSGAQLLVSNWMSSMSMIWRLDGTGLTSDLRAMGRSIGGDFDISGRHIPTVDNETGALQLWDPFQDKPVGDPAAGLGWLTDQVLERWTEESGRILHNVVTGKQYPLTAQGALADLPAEAWLTDGGSGPHAFAVAEDSLVPFDPLTGQADGPPLPIGEARLYSKTATVDETPDGARVVVTWWDAAAERSVTTLFDSSDGSILAQGLYNLDGTAFLPSGDIVGASNDRLVLADGSTLEQRDRLSHPAGGSLGISVSADGRTLVNEGFDHRITVYDLTGSIKLGDPIDAIARSDAEGVQMSDDGKTLLQNAADGILVWDIDPAHQFEAACRIAGRELISDEWRTYLGESEPQVATCAGVLD